MKVPTIGRTVAALAATLACAPVLAQESEPVCLAIPPFANTSEWSDDAIGAAAAAELTDLLFASGRFTIVGPAQLAPILDEAGVEALDPFDRVLMAQLATAVGCPNVLAGRVAQFGVESYSAGVRMVRGRLTRAEATVIAYLIDTSVDAIVVDVQGEGSKTAAGGSVRQVRAEIEADVGMARETLRPALEEIAARVAREAGVLSRGLPSAAPVSVGNVVGGGEDGSIYIDLGEAHGVEVGHRFQVLRVVDEIRGTDGALLDTLIEPVGVVAVSRVLSRSAICTLVEGEAARGDTIRPVEPEPDGA